MSEDRFDQILKQLRAWIDEHVEAQHTQRIAIADAAATLAPGDMAELILGARRVRNRHFGGKLFGEPAWDMLLELHTAHYRDQAISVSAAVTFGDTAATTGLRWLAILEADGLIKRRGDPRDQRRYFVELSPEGLEKMDSYVAAFGAWVGTKARLRKL